MSCPVEAERVRELNAQPPNQKGDYVLYWMQQSQRAEFNAALEWAIHAANEAKLPVLCGFGLTDAYPGANARHYSFMLEGLRDVEIALRNRGIGFTLRLGSPPEVALRLALKAALVVVDRGYLRHQRAWREQVASGARCRVVQVESDVVVPVEIASQKSEIGARTLRPRIWRHAERFLRPLRSAAPNRPWTAALRTDFDPNGVSKLLSKLDLDRSVAPVGHHFVGGTGAARMCFDRFCRRHLHLYAEHRSHPETDEVSQMSKYLHFGQISPVWLALQAEKFKNAEKLGGEVFIEELLVRRELAMNFVAHEPNYDSFDCVPAWARRTLQEHESDPREHLYALAELENAETHDRYWNAAMREMRFTGFMHNHMRMYWGKKILEWSATPEEAHSTLLKLNNKYFLDGRDPNSYGNAGWIFGLHDRPWPERPIFGKVRSMTASGLERKCDIEAYCRKVDALVKPAGGDS